MFFKEGDRIPGVVTPFDSFATMATLAAINLVYNLG